MTIITLHHLFFCHCVNSLVIFLDLGIFFGSCAPSEKYLRSKQSPPISHNDLKKDRAQLLLSKFLIRNKEEGFYIRKWCKQNRFC